MVFSATGCVSPRASWEGPYLRPTSAATCTLLGAIQQEPLINPEVVVTSLSSEVCLERPIYLPQQLSLGLLSERRGVRHAEVRCYLFRNCEPLRDFGRVHSMSQNKLFIWKSLKEAAGVDPQAG